MDVITGLKNELFRPLVSLVVPGSVAVAPFILVLQSRIPAVSAYWEQHPSVFISIAVVVVIAAALCLENIGSRIEESCWDRLLAKYDGEFDSIWRRYLRLNTQDQIVGQRYLRTLLTRMKFELSMVPAILFHIVGLNWANAHLGFFSSSEMVAASTALGVVAVYLSCESYGTAKALHRLRRDVIAACRR
jgi:hypothetical protein